MKDVALLINVQNKHKKYTRFIENGFDRNEDFIDLYCVYDNNEQYEMFKYKFDFKYIINGDETFFKIYYAMGQLQKQYKYFVILNVDSIILKLNNISEICKRFCEIKKIYGNVKENDTIKDCLQFLHSDLDSSINFYNSQIPIYDSSILPDFFHHVNKKRRQNTGQIFDNLELSVLYYYYCVKFKGYEIVDLEKLCNINVGNSLENRMSVKIRTILDLHQVEINWQTLNNITLFHYLDEQILFIYNVSYSTNPKTKFKYRLYSTDVYSRIVDVYG